MIHSSRLSRRVVSHRNAVCHSAVGSERRGFTLIEILVALALFMIMLAIVFIPMNLGINMFHIGKARSEAQGAAVSTMNQMENEFRRAIYIYPNDALPGVTDQAPYTNNKKLDPSDPNYSKALGYPYVQTSGALTLSSGACDRFSASMTVPERVVGNTARLDLLVPRLTSQGTVQTPVTPDYYLVTYYARRLKADKPFDIIDNPIVIFRAQIPYRRNTDSASFKPAGITAGAINADTGLTRYSSDTECSSGSTVPNRNSFWLTQGSTPIMGEPNLEPLCSSTNTDSAETALPVEGTHTLVTPRGMALVSRVNPDNPKATLGDVAVGDLKGVAFLCADSNGDGKIDRVTINLSLGQYDSAGGSTRNGQGSAQSAQLSQTVELPNIPKS